MGGEFLELHVAAGGDSHLRECAAVDQFAPDAQMSLKDRLPVVREELVIRDPAGEDGVNDLPSKKSVIGTGSSA